MSSQIDFRTLPANVPVLCIPRVYPNISEGRIRKIFDDLDMGTLERIDIVSKTSEKGEKFNRVFVHFRRWNNSENSNIARERLLNGKEIKIIYDEPWFWKISAYRESATRREPAAPQQQSSGHRGKPTITFDSDEDKCSRPTVSTNHSINRDDKRRCERPSHAHSTHRRADSRERLGRNDYHYYNNLNSSLNSNRRDDSRERPRRRDDSRERPNYEKQKMPQRKFVETTTPHNSPIKERVQPKQPEENKVAGIAPEYGDIKILVRRNTFGKSAQPKNEKEEGEVEEGEVNEEE